MTRGGAALGLGGNPEAVGEPGEGRGGGACPHVGAGGNTHPGVRGASSTPAIARCPVRIDGRPHIGRSRPFAGTCDRSIGFLSGPLARCRPIGVCVALGTSSRPARA
jgi:hypothetical protein